MPRVLLPSIPGGVKLIGEHRVIQNMSEKDQRAWLSGLSYSSTFCATKTKICRFLSRCVSGQLPDLDWPLLAQTWSEDSNCCPRLGYTTDRDIHLRRSCPKQIEQRAGIFSKRCSFRILIARAELTHSEVSSNGPFQAMASFKPRSLALKHSMSTVMKHSNLVMRGLRESERLRSRSSDVIPVPDLTRGSCRCCHEIPCDFNGMIALIFLNQL